MGDKFPALNYREVIKKLKKAGFVFYQQGKGSHEVWLRPDDGSLTTIPHHTNKILKRKTLKAIIKDAGLTVREFIRL